MAHIPKTAVSSSRILALPLELQSSIIDKLDAGSLLNFRITNRYFQSLISRPPLVTLLSAEKTIWAQSRRGGLYACMGCRRLRPSKEFADAMKKGPKGRNGKEPQKRFCVECGVKWGGRGGMGYSPGAEIEAEGVRSVVCKKCRKWKEDSVYEIIGCKGSGLCGMCHGGNEGCERARQCVRGFAVASRKGGRHWGTYGDSIDYELPDGYDEAFWECYDPAD